MAISNKAANVTAKAPAMAERPMPPPAPASLHVGRPPRPESFIPGPDTCTGLGTNEHRASAKPT